MYDSPLSSFNDSTAFRATALRVGMLARLKKLAIADSDTSTDTAEVTTEPTVESHTIPRQVTFFPKRRPTRYMEGYIPVATDISLEALVKIPGPLHPLSTNKIAILSHSSGWFGGNMDDPVLDAISSAFLRLDYHVILFNSRGVRHSTGHSSFTGVPESQDLTKIIEWGLQEVGSVDTVVLLGYSHGSLVTSLLPSPHKVFPGVKRSSHILLSHAVGPSSFRAFFNRGKYNTILNELVAEPTSNVLVIWGDEDQFISKNSYHAWSSKLEAKAEQCGTKDSGIEVNTLDGIGQLLSYIPRWSTDNLPTKRGNHSFPLSVTNSLRIVDVSSETEKRSSTVIHSGSTVGPDVIPPFDQPRPVAHNRSCSEPLRLASKSVKPHVVSLGTVTHGAFQSTMIAGADHFWHGGKGREMRSVITKWITRLDSGDFDTIAGSSQDAALSWLPK